MSCSNILTAEEMIAIDKLNETNRWGMDRDELESIINEHKKARVNGDTKTMAKIEYRLTDINFHSECELLESGKYGEAMKSLEDY